VKKHYWRLPEGVDEVLPPDALYLEKQRRTLIDLFVSWGYSFVIPPMVEYLDALMVGAGQDLDLQTIKFVDQATGRMLGMRADITSQTARIDAHSLKTKEPQRLCYTGTVLRANPRGVSAKRNPIMVGAEIFGSANLTADAEIISLMTRALNSIGVNNLVVELGHIGIYRALVDALGIDSELESELFTAVQMKSSADVELLLGGVEGKPEIKACLLELPDMMGGAEVFETASLSKAALPALDIALERLQTLADLIRQNDLPISLRFDLGELTGYGYHTGIVFTAYTATHGQPVARGGRYDGIGKAFGETRSATGFDLDLKALPKSLPVNTAEKIWVALNTATDGEHLLALMTEVERLRLSGRVVVFGLEENAVPVSGCGAELVFEKEHWNIKKLETDS